MASTWRQLDFFQSEAIADYEDASLVGPSIFATTSQGSVICADHGLVFLGDQSGTLHALNEQFAVVAEVSAYAGGSIDHILTCSRNLIATIGQEGGEQSILKVFELRTTSNKAAKQSFKHLSSTTIQNDKPYPITCFTAVDDLTHVAVGFSDGKVILIKGDLARDRGAKQRTVFEGEEPITALEFLVSSFSTVLYIFSTSRLLTLTIANALGRAVTQVPHVMESVGAALHCVARDKLKNEILVVRSDAIYYYGAQGRGPCYALEGKKSSLHVHAGYAVVVQAPNTSFSGTRKLLGSIGIPDAVDDTSRLTILHTGHKFIAHTSYFAQGLRKVFSQWGALYLLTSDGRILRLRELEISSKLEMLCSKNMFTLALDIAMEETVSEEEINTLRIQYGDHLYMRKEFEAAVKQYVAAIRQCEASAIMRKFLQAQHVPLLTEFLEALHDADLSNADYTTLLLNCYAKLKMKDKLTQFIGQNSTHPIDLDIAVALCRQAGYYDQAIALTAKHNNHAICLGIMIEDKKDYAGALRYIRRLKDAGDVGSMLNQFGLELISELVDETTKLLIDFYTGTFVPQASNHVNDASGTISPQERITTGYGAAFYDSMINSRYTQVLPSLPSLDMSHLNPMRRVTSMTASIVSKNPSIPEKTEPRNNEPSALPGYAVPTPRTAFPIFADHISHFIQFLEAILERQAIATEDQNRTDVVTTLLEAYLQQAEQCSPDTRLRWQNKAKELVKQEESFIDSSNAILLFHLSSFEEGSFLVQERAGRIEDIFRSYCGAKDTENVIKTLHRHGEQEPRLYILALKYFISDAKIAHKAGSELEKVLQKIYEKQLLTPLQVIQSLSTNAVANIGVAKNYLNAIIEKEKKEILSNKSLVESYRKEAQAKEAEALELAQNAMILQVSRCARCGGTLELPVVHFLCKHSFHSRCISTSADSMDCPVCLEANNAVQTIVKSKSEMAERQDFLKESLASSRDKANFLFSRMDLNIDPTFK